MNQYPIVEINREEWNRKVNACLMYTIPSEDEALPILCQIQEILQRLHTLPLHETLGQQCVEYFFVHVFPVACQKIIKSRYFKNQTVLKKANQILEHTVCLLPVYIDLLEKIPQLIEVIHCVFPDEFYYKTNNQLEHKQKPYLYFPKLDNLFQQQLIPGSKVDVLKFSSVHDKYCWTHGTVVQKTQNHILVSYDLDYQYAVKKLQRNSYELAQYQSKATTFQWRKNLKTGDLLDIVDPFGCWYNATVIDVQQQEDGRRKIQVTIKVYNQNGNKIDQQGRYFGFADYKEKYDAFSPEIAPYCSVAKQFSFESSKSFNDIVDDINDMETTTIQGKRVYAVPRKKMLSETIFKAINRFGQLDGFDKVLQKIESSKQMSMLSFYMKGLNGVVGYLHRGLVLEQLSRIKVLIEGNILSQSGNYSKEKSEMMFLGLRGLLKRVYSIESSYDYENRLKIKLVEDNFQHESLKKRLLGLNELKEIVKTLTFSSSRNKSIVNFLQQQVEWIKQRKIFEKVYLQNSHVQLIKKSESFFRYIINQNILEVQNLEKLFKMAQKGDYQTRISLYSLFQEVSHIFKKPHVNFLIDKILESDPHLILNQDIDLLHELSKFSNYFPTQKVMQFFEKIVLGVDIPNEINNYAIKKYSQMVAKNYEMKPYRKEIIKDLFTKLQTHDIRKVTKILKFIFQGIGFGQWGKKDLSELLEQNSFQKVIISSIQFGVSIKNNSQIMSQCMELLLSIYKLCPSFKIQIKTIEDIYLCLNDDRKLIHKFYKWSNEVFRCQQGVEVQDINQIEALFVKLFENRKAKSNHQTIDNQIIDEQSVMLEELELLKSIFVEVNKRKRLLTVSNVMKEKEIQKQYKRKVPMKQLTFYQTLLQSIYDHNDSISCKSLQFFKSLYCSSENSPIQIQQFLEQNIRILKENSDNQGDRKKLLQTLRIIQFIIDDSQKDCPVKIESLISKKKNHEVKLNFINCVSYSSDNVKKLEVTIPINLTLYDLRMHLAKQTDISPKAVKIEINNQEIPYLLNCRTIKELGLTGLQTMTLSKTIVSPQPEADIIINGQVNPKAERIFKKIFDQYSTDGKMGKTQCHEFTVKCLGSASSPKYYEEKINGLFKEYDEDQDELLQFKDFLKFYKNSAISKASTVWANLRSFGVEGNLKFSYQKDQDINTQKLPRKIMSQMSELYDLLFGLLKENDVARQAFELLERLPVSPHVEEKILCVDCEQLNFAQILDTQDLYVFFYRLNVIEYLIFSTELRTQVQKDWLLRFTSNKGFQKLIDTFSTFLYLYQSQTSKRQILLNIIEVLLDMITHFLMKCYRTRQIVQCQLLFAMQVQLSEKIEYLITGKFSKSELIMASSSCETEQDYQCDQFTKEELLNKILCLFELLWKSKTKTQTNLLFEQILLMKVMLLVLLLQINQNLQSFINRIDDFINHSKDLTYLKKLYELILCIAFYSNPGNGQNLIINEMFNHLTKTNIIAEHFSVLAVLVSKYGVESVDEDQIVEALFKNIFTTNNEMTIEGCSKLLLNFNLKKINQKQFDDLWENCLFGQEKRARKNGTREALYDLILKACEQKKPLTNHIISKIQAQIIECIQKMRITSCTQDNQRSFTGYAGLKNLGNICYINSMMQQLYMNKKFRYLVLRIKDYEAENFALYKEKMYDDNILHQLQKIFAYLQLTSRADYVPNGFCLAYKPFGESVNVMIQQDVQEFVSMFFDQLQNKIKSTPFKKVLNAFYGGKTTNLFNCHDCNQTKKVEESFYSITLQVKSSKSLNDSFNRYISGELISDFRCDFCNKKVDVSKKTRISSPPRTLIIHLQRIVFNLDTFINQKISTRHQFPMDLDLYPYSLAEYEKPKEATQQEQIKIKDSMQYHLSGIICHIGNAQSGHYISYIKIEQNKWLEFNDSIVTSFSQANIESQCFGGVVNNFMDDFEWDKSSESSKSAYILLYERKGQAKIQAIVKSLQEKGLFFKEYELYEVLEKVFTNQKLQEKGIRNSQDSESEAVDDEKLQDQIFKLQVQQQIRKKSQEITLEFDKGDQNNNQLYQNQQISIQIDQNISCFIPETLKKQILHDNQIHFFEKNLSSPAFVKFFANLLRQPHDLHDNIIKIFKNLTFGFWTKSQHFKNLLKACAYFIELDPKYSDQLIFYNPQVVLYLIENPDSEVRTNLAQFLSSSLSNLIHKNNLTLTGQGELDKKILAFLDNLFSLLPTTVSKAWTKFGQYFEFWHDFGKKGQVEIAYLIRKQVLKNFLDYYLDKKSPLKIYENKPQIGSKYANPNFSMLLKTVAYLATQILNSGEFKFSKDDYKILINFDCMQKIISENYENLATNIVKEVCKNNLYASQKIAILILKGLHKSTFNDVQPYLDVLHEYMLIEDGYQALRAKWVLGKPVINLSMIAKQIQAITSYAFQERVYKYNSSIVLQQASSLLDPIFQLHKRAQNFAMMSLRQALKLCMQSDYIFEYIWSLPPPSLCYGTIYDFYLQFIERYTQQARKGSNFNQSGFNKQELGTQVRTIYDQLIIRWFEKHPLTKENKNQLNQQKQSSQNKNLDISSIPTSEQSVSTSPKKLLNEHQFVKSNQYLKKYFPVKFKFIEKEKSQLQGLQIIRHQSELTFVLLEPTGKSNDSFITGVMKRNDQKLKQSVWQTAKIEVVTGFFVTNKSKNLLRTQTQDGTYLIKPTDSLWIWCNRIDSVWICQKTGDWPKWNLYSMEQNEKS